MMEMAVPGRRKRRRPRRRWIDLAREDMERVGAKEGDKVDREKWKILSRCGDPEYGEAERRSYFPNSRLYEILVKPDFSFVFHY